VSTASNPTRKTQFFYPKFFKKMKFTKFSMKLCGATAIAIATLLDAAPSKAVLYIDFIPLSPTSTRIQASGSLTPSLLGTPAAGSPVATAQTGNNTSGINRNSDTLRFTYGSTASLHGTVFAMTGSSNPFTVAGTFLAHTGITPTKTPPFVLQLGSTGGIRLPNTLTNCTHTGCPSPSTTALAFSGFFDVNLSLAQIGLSGPPITYTSGSEQIILRDATPAPGPVPLLGAAAAFGYSRKLRHRIQKSTLSRTA
jgi:hypothetical protein